MLDDNLTRTTNSVQPQDHRAVISMDRPEDDINFITLHNILYYLYTGCVNLRFESAKYPHKKTSHPPGYPLQPDPFELYKNAKKFLIKPLSDYCLQYLEVSLTPRNVIKRLFREDGVLKYYDEIAKLYVKYVLANFDEVKKCEDWVQVRNFEESDPEVRELNRKILFDIIDKLTYPQSSA
jgi:hypothetical protein